MAKLSFREEFCPTQINSPIKLNAATREFQIERPRTLKIIITGFQKMVMKPKRTVRQLRAIVMPKKIMVAI